MNPHVKATLEELEVRRSHLLEQTERRHETELQLLLNTTLRRLEALKSQIDTVLREPRWGLPAAEPYVYRRVRRIVRELDRLEAFPITALSRWGEADARLTRLTSTICAEVGFPRPHPVVAGLSQSYYEARSEFDLLFTPATESSFLLHLPDLYHELGHLVVAADEDPKIAPMLSALKAATQAGTQHCLRERRREAASSRAPHGLARAFDTWATRFPYWTEELLCDVLAVATCGPAFAWAHLHLWIKRGDDPWQVGSSTHPPDAARLECMLDALRIRGFAEDANDIEDLWPVLTTGAGASQSAPFRRCFPRRLLATFASDFLSGLESVGFHLVEPGALGGVASVLGEAWARFRTSSLSEYRQWEKCAADRLFAKGC